MNDNKISSDQINKIWDRYTNSFDDLIGGNKRDMDLFIRGGDHAAEIAQLINIFTPFVSDHKNFFDTFNYDWCLDSKSYRLSAEVVFQFRAIRLLESYIDNDQNKDTLRFLSKPIVVREAILSGLVQPKAIQKEGIIFIILPLGWFEFYHLIFYGVQCIAKKQLDTFKPLVLSICGKILIENSFDKYIDNHPNWFPQPHVSTYLKLELFKILSKDFADFKEMHHNILSEDIENETYSQMYSGETFLLAHEIAHVLLGDLENAERKANEIETDDLAIKILMKAKGQIQNHNYPHEESLVMAAQSFLFFQKNLLGYLFKLGDVQAEDLEYLQRRALSIQSMVRHFNLEEHSIKRINSISQTQKEYFQRTKDITEQITLKKDEINSFLINHLEILIKKFKV